MKNNQNIKFGVFENNKPATLKGSKKWKNHLFNTFEEAHQYLNWRLGDWGPVELEVNEKYDYDGYGDVVEIKEI